MAETQKGLPGLTLLTDQGMAASKAWGLATKGAEQPSPGTFVIEREGTVRYRKLEDAAGDWPTYDQLASVLDGK